MALICGTLFIILALFKPQSITPAEAVPYFIGAGLAFLSVRTWTMNGATGSTMCWYFLAPIMPMMYCSQRVVNWFSAAGAVAVALTIYFCEVYPFSDYSKYPTTLGYLLTGYVLTVLGFEIHSMYKLHVAIESEVDKQRLHAQQNAKMASVGRLASQIASELKNSFAKLIQLNQRLISLHGKNSDPEAIEALEMQSKLIKQTNHAVSTLITSAQKSTAKALGVVHPSAVLSAAKANIEKRLLSHQIRFNSHVEKGRDIKPLYSSQPVITQALTILLSNSIDALATNTDSTADKWINVHFIYEDDFLLIDVVDSGEGIPEALHEKIFEPYFSSKPKNKNSGLGLSVCREIIEEINGFVILMTKSPNTHFRIKLPLESAAKMRDKRAS